MIFLPDMSVGATMFSESHCLINTDGTQTIFRLFPKAYLRFLHSKTTTYLEVTSLLSLVRTFFACDVHL